MSKNYNETRTRPPITITLSTEALDRLDAIAQARGQSRSGAIEALIRKEKIPRG